MEYQVVSQVSMVVAKSAGRVACMWCPAGMVAMSQRGIRAATAASLSWGDVAFWAAAAQRGGCSDITKAMPGRRVILVDLADDGRCGQVEVSGFSRSFGDSPVSREGRRDVLDGQPADPDRLLPGDQIGHGGAHRMTGERDRERGKLVEHAEDVVTHQLE
jgi:hypothetical protein